MSPQKMLLQGISHWQEVKGSEGGKKAKKEDKVQSLSQELETYTDVEKAHREQLFQSRGEMEKKGVSLQEYAEEAETLQTRCSQLEEELQQARTNIDALQCQLRRQQEDNSFAMNTAMEELNYLRSLAATWKRKGSFKNTWPQGHVWNKSCSRQLTLGINCELEATRNVLHSVTEQDQSLQDALGSQKATDNALREKAQLVGGEEIRGSAYRQGSHGQFPERERGCLAGAERTVCQSARGT